MKRTEIKIHSSDEYFEELMGQISETGPGQRATVVTMSFDPNDRIVSNLLAALEAAARRGVKVDLVLDAYSFMLNQRNLPIGPVMIGFPSVHSSRQKYFQEKYQALEQIKNAGGSYHIIDLPTESSIPLPFAMRSHVKCAVVGDSVFIGGCNLERTWQFDYMAELKNERAADWLQAIIDLACQKNSFRKALRHEDIQFKVDDETTILMDAGKPGQSLIYRTALNFIDQAEDWLVMTCQYSPSPNTAKHLNRAYYRNVDVRNYYNNPHNNAANERWIHYGFLAYEKLRYPKGLFEYEIDRDERRLHAKLLASENGMIVGSQNYVVYSVLSGIGEIALFTTDRAATISAVQKLEQAYSPITATLDSLEPAMQPIEDDFQD